MRVHLAADHAGFDLKQHLIAHLRAEGHEVIDHGAQQLDPLDDYPGFCIAAAEGVVNDPGSLGIVLGGSGNGEQIAANKVPGVRAVLGWNEETARLGRAHNDANVLSLGARQHSAAQATKLLEVFLAEPFSFDPRHQRRIDLITRYERGAARSARAFASGDTSSPG